ncbi:MAG TPA: hypothetical protein VHD55_02205 [Candidatus Paceibacterota bacterium]|nr:hypothetical protein [Candidatus Paceibacterota bacterium]
MLLITLALFIDMLQAGISLAIALLAAVPGTAIGAAGGAVAGASLCSYVGLGAISGWCSAIGGFAVGFFATPLNALAVVTEPVGIAVGFAINMCLSICLGAFLLMLMAFFLKKIYVKNLFFGLGEMIPGINNIPFWTAFVVVSLLKKSAEDGTGALSGMAAVATTAMSPGSALGNAAGGIMRAKEKTTEIADRTKAFSSPLMLQPLKGYKQQQDNLGDHLNQEQINPGSTPRESASAQAARNIFNDIRPIRKAAAVLLAFALFGAGVQAAYAQAVDPLRFVITPEIPTPGAQVAIEAQGVGNFLGDATFTWQQDGKTVLTGMGERRLTFTVGNVGAATRIHVTIQSPTNGTIDRDFTLVPSVVHLLWEADTSVPPLYRGKALYSAGSTFRVIALPQVVAGGATITYNNLSFQWSLNGEPAVNQSGKGRSSAAFQGSQLRASENVSVDVYLGAQAVGRASITIPAVDPELSLYIQDPLRGTLYDQAMPATISLLNTEVTLKAEPFYFSNDSIRNGAAAYTWTLNGTPATGPDSARGILTLRQTGNGGGEGRLGVELQNTDPTRFVQAARAALRILFNGTANSNTTSSFGV